MSLAAIDKPAHRIKAQFISDYEKFAGSVNRLEKASKQSSVNWVANATAFYEARIAFKRVEMIFSYLDPEFVKDHINGAPLPHTERKAPDLVIIAPSGFQIMEEALVGKNIASFQKHTEKLNHKTAEFQRYLPTIQLSERMVFESMREELVRIAALGITGFDAPSEINVLKESETAIEALNQSIQFYHDYLDSDQIQVLTQIFAKSSTYFSETDFVNFNRFGFIKDVINPLYKTLLHFQKKLNIETRDLSRNIAYSTNYEAENLFETDFLNYRYYSKYSEAGIEDKRQELGKLLIYDPILSGNNERACVSCHNPKMGFSDGQKTSIAYDKTNTLSRNSPTLLNAVYNTRFFWDARASTPEDQIEHVLFNPDELNSNYAELIDKLNTSPTYVNLFKAAYPEYQNDRNEPISRYTIVASMTAYLQSLRSFNSDFDKEIKGETTSNNPQLTNGFNIFTGKGKCATCHFVPTFAGNVPPLYTDTETEVLAVPLINNIKQAKLDSDLGRFANGRPKEKTTYNRNAFKTPSLRNVALTAPYMHNGVFNTLEEVVDFYNIGGGHGWGIAPENTTLAADSLQLSPSEVEDLILFMEALTDTNGFTSPPENLPKSTISSLNARKIGGTY